MAINLLIFEPFSIILCLFVEVSDTHVDILGMSYRGDKKGIKTFQNLMNDIYGLNLKY